MKDKDNNNNKDKDIHIILTSNKSPCCNEDLFLTVEKRCFIVKNSSVDIDLMIYKCNKCGAGWTTTDSDEISIDSIIYK